ncbi:maspardin-like [Scyliorhinus canicula]|uniref:maspardin-like n=1 Tax=Scyliorhinus canicula TaxID=7830 RepID=UPI0018F561A8|nr:maspardin-like [Scyliorhinus canicula]
MITRISKILRCWNLNQEQRILEKLNRAGSICRRENKGFDIIPDCLESLGQGDLVSRLTLNCQTFYVGPHKIKDVPVTIIDNLWKNLSPMDWSLHLSAKMHHMKHPITNRYC